MVTMKTGAAETAKLARKSAQVGDAELTPQEAERRRKQRELQAYALKLKTEGLAYKPQKHKRKVLKEPTSTAGQPKTASKKSGKSKSKHDTPTWRPYNTTCQVVILPIYWNMRHAEKEAVMAAAAKVEELLREAGITTHTDTANQYTPGQKMKYWETAGVRVRVELGPKDALQGTAVVALSGTPGTVARKKSVNVTVQLVQAVKALLEQATGPGGDEGEGSQEHDQQEDQAADQQDRAQATGPKADASSSDAGPGSAAEAGSGKQQAGNKCTKLNRQSKQGVSKHLEEGQKGEEGERMRQQPAVKLHSGGREGKQEEEKGGGEEEEEEEAGEEAGEEGSDEGGEVGSGHEARVRSRLSHAERKALQRKQLLAAPRHKLTRKQAKKQEALQRKGWVGQQEQQQQQAAGEDEADAGEDRDGEAAVAAAAREAAQQTGVKRRGKAGRAEVGGEEAEASQASLGEHRPCKQPPQAPQAGNTPDSLAPPSLSLAAGAAESSGPSGDRAATCPLSSKQHKAAMPSARIPAQAQPAEADARSQKPLDGGGGDDLADDFEIDAEFLAAPEEEVLTLSKVQRMKHAKKQAKDRKRKRFGDGLTAWDADVTPDQAAVTAPLAAHAAVPNGKGGKKRAAVVKF
ncbi:hypothetical protein QJQ45_026520 [Haematococcus lacustris]|nr:hypothetical protein QJQ45_026520 [Haematococcus lacustris]